MNFYKIFLKGNDFQIYKKTIDLDDLKYTTYLIVTSKSSFALLINYASQLYIYEKWTLFVRIERQKSRGEKEKEEEKVMILFDPTVIHFAVDIIVIV